MNVLFKDLGFWGEISCASRFLAGILVLTHFRYDTDRRLSPEEAANAPAFYAAAYDSEKSRPFRRSRRNTPSSRALKPSPFM